MRRWGALLGALLLSGALAAGCTCTQTPEQRIGRALGVRLPEAVAVSVADDHGGFHGDGKTVAVLSFSAADGEALAALLQQAAHWRPLPATENTRRLLGGNVVDWGLGDGVSEVTDGFWYVHDRHDECDDPYSDAALFGRYSINVTAAVYDRAAHTLYYFELDT